jgi:AcrR family transcriptional regulator
MVATSPDRLGSPSSARERILDTAYDLFSQRGIRGVGVDEVVERSGVAKATLYRHFPAKDDLVVAFLELREQRWSRGLEMEAKRRGTSPEDQLLAIFDVFEEWFRRDDFEACSFVNTLLELGPQHPAARAAAVHLANIRSILCELAEAAGLRDPAGFAHSLQLVMKGSIIAAEGDANAAKRGRSIARLLVDDYRCQSAMPVARCGTTLR